jgi:hypothetical protein
MTVTGEGATFDARMAPVPMTEIAGGGVPVAVASSVAVASVAVVVPDAGIVPTPISEMAGTPVPVAVPAVVVEKSVEESVVSVEVSVAKVSVVVVPPLSSSVLSGGGGGGVPPMGVTTNEQDLSCLTKTSPFSPSIGVRVTSQVSVIVPAGVSVVVTVWKDTGSVSSCWSCRMSNRDFERAILERDDSCVAVERVADTQRASRKNRCSENILGI